MLAKKVGKVVGGTVGSTVGIVMIGVNVFKKGLKIANDYKNSVGASTAIDALTTGNNAMCMCVEGTVVYTSGNTSGSIQICGLEYDETELKIRNAAYNVANDQNMTVDQLKEHYVNGDEEFQQYSDWYFSPHAEEQNRNYKLALRKIIEMKYDSLLEDASDEQIEEASQQLSEIINDTDTNELLDKDYAVIEKAIEESVG